MTIEALEILDSAVKIGLGALISGVATYSVTLRNQKYELHKVFLDRRLNTIEVATDSVDTHFIAFSRFIAAISGAQQLNPEEKELSENSYKFIRRHDDELCDSRAHWISSISKLRLLALDNSVAILNELSNIENDIRNKVVFEKLMPTLDELEHWSNTFVDIKKRFYKEVSNAYCS